MGGRFQCDEHSPLGVPSIDRRPAGVWDGALVPVAARGAAAPTPPPSRLPMNVTRVEGLTVTCIRGHHREIFGAGFTEHSSYVIAGTAAVVPASGDWAVVRATVTGGGVSAALVGVARPDSGHLSSISGDPTSLPPGRPNWALTRTLGLAPPYRPSGPVRPPPGAQRARRRRSPRDARAMCGKGGLVFIQTKIRDRGRGTARSKKETRYRTGDYGHERQCRKRTFRFSRDSAPGPARPTGAPGVPCLPADCASARTEVEFPPQNHSYENREKRQCTACTAKEASMYTYVLSRSSEVYSCSIKEQRMYRTPR